MNRAGTFKAGYSKKKDVVYPLPAFEGSPTSVTTEFDGTTREVTVLSGNSPETTSSESKGREKVRELHMSATSITKTEETTKASRLATDAVLEVFRVLASRSYERRKQM